MCSSWAPVSTKPGKPQHDDWESSMVCGCTWYVIRFLPRIAQFIFCVMFLKNGAELCHKLWDKPLQQMTLPTWRPVALSIQIYLIGDAPSPDARPVVGPPRSCCSVVLWQLMYEEVFHHVPSQIEQSAFRWFSVFRPDQDYYTWRRFTTIWIRISYYLWCLSIVVGGDIIILYIYINQYIYTHIQ